MNPETNYSGQVPVAEQIEGQEPAEYALTEDGTVVNVEDMAEFDGEK